MTCREFADFMMDYLTGDLPLAARAEFERHLSACRNCRRYLAGYRETLRLGQQAFNDAAAPVPAMVPEALVGAILAARRQIQTGPPDDES
jgi:anti-sigma factor RsiW